MFGASACDSYRLTTPLPPHFPIKAKLASVPDADPAEAPTTAAQGGPSNEGGEGSSGGASATASSTTEPSAEEAAPTTAIVPAADPNQIAISKHPDYIAFFKQLKVGAPLPAVQMKVSAAGLDPSMMELDPETLVPFEGGGEEEQAEAGETE